MARKKIAQHSKAIEGLSKTEGLWNYLQTDAFRFFPDKDAWRQRLIFSLYEWVESEDNKGRKPVEVMQFCKAYKIPYMTLFKWINKYDDIKQAYENVKMALACHRKVGAIYKEIDKEAAWRDLHKYDPEWHEINMYHAALKDKERSDNEQKIVIIERFPESDLVPVKDKE